MSKPILKKCQIIPASSLTSKTTIITKKPKRVQARPKPTLITRLSAPYVSGPYITTQVPVTVAVSSSTAVTSAATANTCPTTIALLSSTLNAIPTAFRRLPTGLKTIPPGYRRLPIRYASIPIHKLPPGFTTIPHTTRTFPLKTFPPKFASVPGANRRPPPAVVSLPVELNGVNTNTNPAYKDPKNLYLFSIDLSNNVTTTKSSKEKTQNIVPTRQRKKKGLQIQIRTPKKPRKKYKKRYIGERITFIAGSRTYHRARTGPVLCMHKLHEYGKKKSILFDDQVAEIISQMTDDIIEDAVFALRKLARIRQNRRIEVKDVMFYITQKFGVEP